MLIQDVLQGKVTIVAGGCGLLGSAFSKAIVQNKGTCIVADQNERAGSEFVSSVKEQIPTADIRYASIDLTDKGSVANVIEEVNDRYGHIDAFVNSAYPRNRNWGKDFFENVTMEDFTENMSLHLGGYFLASQMLCKFFLKQGHGNLVQIASILGVCAPKFDTYKGASFNGNDMNCPVEYSIFKAGIIHFTRYIAAYYKDRNIRSNCISPGGILSGQPEVFLSRYRQHCLSKGMLDPEDVCGTLMYLLSDMSKFVNGQNIIVDDGWTL